MRRRLFTLCAAASLVLCVAVCALWVRSYWVGYSGIVRHETLTADGYRERFVLFASGRGTFGIGFDTVRDDGAEARRLGYTPPRRWRADVGPARAESVAERWLAPRRTGALRAGESFRWRQFAVLRQARPTLLLRGPRVHWWSHSASWEAVFPAWLPAALTAAMPAWAALRIGRTRHRRRAGLCPACGYDLRASPDLCPECGAAASAHA